MANMPPRNSAMADAHQNVILDRFGLMLFSLSIQPFAPQVSYNTRYRTANCGM
jgi:hypothetical protein